MREAVSGCVYRSYGGGTMKVLIYEKDDKIVEVIDEETGQRIDFQEFELDEKVE
jgi:hypothetical protein